ncbi:MAG: phosphoribosylformylglycinamidine cyclo-ligase [Deltaproteobacteria bacterium]|nr:phosphoribosylformylglycinamidine cyclo-ligase [Deltaproteobacteria bacterium]
MAEKRLTYKKAGVDIDKGNALVKVIETMARSTNRPEVLGSFGSFGGLFGFNASKYQDPVLVGTTDGVGTKLIIAMSLNRHNTIGIDLVAMCVNDLISQGAEPLFFLDYLSVGKLDVERARVIIEGVVAGCREAGCSLIGGETAEMPGLYAPTEYDLAGFAVGVMGRKNIVDGSSIHPGDHVVGLASSGLHSNGYTLVRRILRAKRLSLQRHIASLGRTLGEELLEPTRIYVKPVLKMIQEFHVKGIAHITGGGFIHKISRILPEECMANILEGSWNVPPIFDYMQKKGGLSKKEMYRTFNNGIGMVLVVSPDQSEEMVARLGDFNLDAAIIGEIEARSGEKPKVAFSSCLTGGAS